MSLPVAVLVGEEAILRYLVESALAQSIALEDLKELVMPLADSVKKVEDDLQKVVDFVTKGQAELQAAKDEIAKLTGLTAEQQAIMDDATTRLDNVDAALDAAIPDPAPPPTS